MDSPPSHPYRDLLSLADRRIYDAIGDTTDLAGEIRLLRTILSRLSKRPTQNAAQINQLATVLIRALYIQQRTHGKNSDTESALLDAAASVLDLSLLEE